MSRKGISARFRKGLDADLIEATAQLDDAVLSDLARDGLRFMLGIRTTRRVEVQERPLVPPQINTKKSEQSTPTPTKPSVFIQRQTRS